MEFGVNPILVRGPNKVLRALIRFPAVLIFPTFINICINIFETYEPRREALWLEHTGRADDLAVTITGLGYYCYSRKALRLHVLCRSEVLAVGSGEEIA